MSFQTGTCEDKPPEPLIRKISILRSLIISFQSIDLFLTLLKAEDEMEEALIFQFCLRRPANTF